MTDAISSKAWFRMAVAFVCLFCGLGVGCGTEVSESAFDEYESVKFNFNGESDEEFGEGAEPIAAEEDIVDFDLAEETDYPSECLGKVYYPDDDGDGFGRHEYAYVACPGDLVPQGFVLEREEGFDCDDTNAQVNPAGDETCDLLDNDCSGAVDDIPPKVCYAPSALGACPGKLTCTEGQTFCDAKEPELEVCDGVDNNCNWSIDEGCSCLDGATQPCGSDVGQCAAGSQTCIAGQWGVCAGNSGPFEEVCDNLDNNCDGDVDELLVLKQSCGMSQVGICTSGTEYKVCDEGAYTDWMGCDAVFPEEENCMDGLDNDCDGDVDTGCCTPDEVADLVECPFEPNSLVFVIDNSGSMSDNDPNDIRYSGLLSVIELLSDEDQATVVAFNTDPLSTGPFTEDKEVLESYLNQAQVYGLGPWGYDGGTAIGKAIVEGAMPLLGQGDHRRTIILLTDGETGSDDLYQHPPTTVGTLAKAHDIRVYAIGLGNSVDEDYLEQISNGNYYPVDSANGIPAIYENVFLSIGYQSWGECQADGTWKQVIGDCGEF